jgi:hypothetical protein
LFFLCGSKKSVVGLEAIEWMVFLCPGVLSSTIHVCSTGTTKSSSLPPAPLKPLLVSLSTLFLLISSSPLLLSSSPLLLSSSSFPHISLASLGHPIRQSAICRKFPFATPLAFLSAQPFAQCKTAYIADVIHATM